MSVLAVLADNLVSWFLLLFGISFPLILLIYFIGLTGFREISRFQKHSTFYYKLNPLTKIAFGLAVTVITATTIWWIGLIITIGVLLSYATLKNGFKKIIMGTYLATGAVLGVTWAFAPYTPTYILECAVGKGPYQTVWTWPSYFSFMGFQSTLTLQALFYGLQISMRFSAIILAALILIMTSTPSEILKALQKFKVPIPIIFSLVVAMRTVPRIFDSIDTAVKIQFMRGLGRSGRGPAKIYYMIIAAFNAIIPSMIFLFRGAKNTAISADTRGFRAFNTRTYLRPLTFSRLDTYMFAIIIAMIAVSVVAIVFGFGRGIPYYAPGTFKGCVS